MTYQIEEIKGAFVVTELKPVTLGTFLDPGHAHLFVAALEQGFQPKAVGAGTDTRPKSEPGTPEPSSDVTGTQDGPPQVRSEEELEKDFEHALARIEAGERCGDVASDMNLPFGALRARRAAFLRAQRAELAEVSDKGKRKTPVPWNTELDLEVMDAREDEPALERIAAKAGRSLAQCKARVEVLLEQARREMEG